MKIGKLLVPALWLWLALSNLNSPYVHAQTSRAATASSYLARGSEWHAKGEYERALADFDLAIATDPSQAIAYCNRGATQHQLKAYEIGRAHV